MVKFPDDRSKAVSPMQFVFVGASAVQYVMLRLFCPVPHHLSFFFFFFFFSCSSSSLPFFLFFFVLVPGEACASWFWYFNTYI